MTPPDRVLDLFAVPDDVEPLTGARTTSVRAGDLVLTPGRDPRAAAWLSPLLARLAVGLDDDPLRSPRDLRVAVPVPARDGSWVVEGWGASRFEPGTTPCRDLAVTLAAGRVLHARLASAVPTRPAELAVCEEPAPASLAGQLDGSSLGVDQLVHAELAGNVLLDPYGAPVITAVRPAWRAVRWAEALCVLDSVLLLDAPAEAFDPWRSGAARQAMLRAIAFRSASDGPEAYREVLAAL